MPRKPRSQRKRYRRKLRETHIPNLISLRDFLFEYHLYTLGESESGTQVATLANMMAMSIQETIDLLEKLIGDKM